ncbi:MAG: hydroxymethylglutaryl-CoA reductase [Candidatus Daviesbacteria bacterium]|nr:hydroxymethylglutaryl-CoA reductase [Candidatus Daviesbacteria bacterium]
MDTKPNLRKLISAQKRREFLEKQLNINLDKIGRINFKESDVVGRNIENLIGSTQIPLGVAGPLRIHLEGAKAHLRGVFRNYYIPLATTEGALVASVSRGCKAITEAGGAITEVENVGITRGPVFRTTGLKHGTETKQWIQNHIPLISQITQKTSSHLKLLKVETAMAGRNLFVRFYFDTKDAMGMNMATFATEQAVKLIEQKTQVICISLAGNFDIDKKPAWLNFINGRGKKVWAEIVLPEKIVADILKTTPEKMVDLVERKCHLGGIMSGSLGFNAHFANIIAAVFASTGQDLAHVVESSLGVTSAEILEKGDLYFSVYLPSLIAGTVGGGTHLPTQQEALGIMQVSDVLEYSQVLGAAVLAGELSLLASLAEGSLAKAHQRLGRK